MYYGRIIKTYFLLTIILLLCLSTTQEEPNNIQSLIGDIVIIAGILNIVFFVFLMQNQNKLKAYDSKSYTPIIWYIVVGLFFIIFIFNIVSLIMIIIQNNRIKSIIKSYQLRNIITNPQTKQISYQSKNLGGAYVSKTPTNVLQTITPPIPKIHSTEESNSPIDNSALNKIELNKIEDYKKSFNVKYNEKNDYTEYSFDNNTDGYFDQVYVKQFNFVKENEQILCIHNRINGENIIINIYARQSGWVFYKNSVEYGKYFAFSRNQCFLIIYKTEDALINAQLNNNVVLKEDLFTKRPIIIGEKYGGSNDGFKFGPFITYPEYNNGEHRFNILFGGRKFYLYRNFTIILLMDSGKLIYLDKLVKPTKNNNYNYTEKTYSIITFDDVNILASENILKIRVVNSGGAIELECDPFENNSAIQKAFKNYINKYISLFMMIDPSDYNQNKEEENKSINNKEKKCYVYLMKDTTNNYHKIGISNKPRYRERTLQSEKPTIELICCKQFPSRKIAESFEKALHNTYSEKRIRGEWFNLNDKDIKDLKEALST